MTKDSSLPFVFDSSIELAGLAVFFRVPPRRARLADANLDGAVDFFARRLVAFGTDSSREPVVAGPIQWVSSLDVGARRSTPSTLANAPSGSSANSPPAPSCDSTEMVALEGRFVVVDPFKGSAPMS